MKPNSAPTSKVYCFPAETPLCLISATLRRQPGTVIVMERGEVLGAVHDYAQFVEEHSFYDSPFALGTLLKNVAMLADHVGKTQRIVRKVRDGNRNRIDILSRSRRLIAWMWSDINHTDSVTDEPFLRLRADPLYSAAA